MTALTMQKEGRTNAVLLGLAIIALAMVLGASAAFAGADTTFNTALTKFTDFLEGSGGKIITVMSLAGGIVALASGRFSLGQVAVPVAVGVGAGTGIPIVTSTVTATI
ncbi:type IV secretory pathway VirB2 component (pilin) [Sphingomonas sp. BE138]|nr:type IV secretory pathway VirB2 component (pilin) [Sphingomonas sp. BE138]